MIPILYKANELEFTSNGIGPLADAITCDVIEERNGIYELEMQYPIDGIHYSDLSEDRYIYTTVSDAISDKQAFKIYKITRPINGVVTVYAEHVSYLLNKMIVMPFTAESCAAAMLAINANSVDTCPFTFSTNKTVSATFTVSEPTPIRAILGGSSGSILDVFGTGDYEFDMFNVRLLTNRGSDNGVVLHYGKNITDLERTTDMTNVYTGIVPFWKSGDDDIVTLPEKVIWSDQAETYSYKIAKVVDFSSEWEEAPTAAQLRTRANNYISKNEGWKIKDNIKVSFVNLADTIEYGDKATLLRVKLCDTVTVRYTKLGVDVKAKVVKTNWNSLKSRYNEIEIGDASTSLYTAIVENNVNSIVEEKANWLESELKRQGNLISGGLGGYIVINRDADGTPREILAMNTPDKETASKVLRINMNGIQFSDGYGATPRTAWTIDGTFSAANINADTMKANYVRGGVLALGGKASDAAFGDGQLIVYDKNNAEIGSWTKDGINVKKGIISIGTLTYGTGRTGSSTEESITGKGCIIDTDGSVYAGKLGIYYGKSGSANLYSVIQADPNKAGRLNIYRGAVLGGEKATGRSYAHGLTVFGGPKCETSKRTEGFVVQSDSYFYSKSIFRNQGISDNEFCVEICEGLYASRKAADGFAIYARGMGYIYNLFSKSHTNNYDWSPSDRNLKKNIRELQVNKSKDFIYGLKPVEYIYKDDETNTTRHGFIAQEVEEISDWGVVNHSELYGDKFLSLEYKQIIADLVNVVQAQHKEIEELKEAVYGKTSN